MFTKYRFISCVVMVLCWLLMLWTMHSQTASAFVYQTTPHEYVKLIDDKPILLTICAMMIVPIISGITAFAIDGKKRKRSCIMGCGGSMILPAIFLIIVGTMELHTTGPSASRDYYVHDPAMLPVGMALLILGIIIIIFGSVYKRHRPSSSTMFELLDAKCLESGSTNPKCPKCGSPTQVRTLRGLDTDEEFHICSHYPECKGKMPVINQFTSQMRQEENIRSLKKSLKSRVKPSMFRPPDKKEVGSALCLGCGRVESKKKLGYCEKYDFYLHRMCFDKLNVRLQKAED